MTYSYNKLWGVLFDHKITKIDAKICIAFDCGLDDIVEISIEDKKYKRYKLHGYT